MNFYLYPLDYLIITYLIAPLIYIRLSRCFVLDLNIPFAWEYIWMKANMSGDGNHEELLQ